MKKLILILGMAAIAASTLSFADTTVQKTTTTTTVVAPAVDPKAAMMEKFKEYSTPNQNHRVLDQMVGNWNYTSTFWMDPVGPAETSSGSATAAWTMDGRFIEQNVEGVSMGMPFKGRSITGYDNAQKEYQSVWYDNMGTGLMTVEGAYDPASKTLVQKGDFVCPIYGHTNARWVTKFIDANTYSFETYMTKEGKEFRNMEIIYKRK
jgi:hypothetical protein